MEEQQKEIEELKQSILSMAIEAWRFGRTFENAMQKLSAGEGQKYLSKYNWFMKKMHDALETAGMRYVNLEGKAYSEGLPVSAINVEDFEADDSLFVEQMLEPVIMEGEKIKKTGTVILGRIVQ